MRSMAPARTIESRPDPVTLEIVKNAFASIADEMALVVLRSAYSPIVRDSMDYSTAVCDRDGRLIAQGLTNPVHLGSFPSVMEHIVARFGPTMRPGDGYVTNDPYGAGGMHLPDVYLIRPVFKDGAVEGFVCTLVHHADLGGMAPGSMALHATEIFQEGLRIPLIKLFDQGRMDESVAAFMTANSRMPEELMGDLRAQIAACTAGERAFAKLLDKYGAPMMRAIVTELHDYSERLVRNAIQAMPDGQYEAVDYIDGLGETGGPIRFQVKVTVSGDEVEIDWTGTSPQVSGAINGPVAITYSVAYAAVRCAIGVAVPNCGGYTRPIRLVAPEGTIVNPRPPAACAARGVMAYRMLDVLFAAFAQAVPERMPAAGEGGPSAVSLSGFKAGARWLITEGVMGSWGGRYAKDGIDGLTNPGAGLTNMPVELLEARYPIRVDRYGFVLNSGGAGRHRGGMAITRCYRILGEEAALTVRSDRRAHLPPGLFGGLPGSPSLNMVERDGAQELLPVMPMRTIALRRGDCFIHVAPSGAGYGPPLERDPDRVADDVADRRITVAFARDVYGVVLREDNRRPDPDATVARRRELAREPSSMASTQLAGFMAADPVRAAFAADVGERGAAVSQAWTDCGRHDRSRLMRPSWAEIDLGALRRNVAQARAAVGSGVKIFFVCKGDGFGFGAAAMARAAEKAGVDGFCVGSPEEIVAVRAGGATLPILLFASTLPEDLPAAAALGAMVTIQSPVDLDAVLATTNPIEIFLEIDCGLGRFGLTPRQLPQVLERMRAAPHLRVRGLYGHLSSPDDPALSRAQAKVFHDAGALARSMCFADLLMMLASSRVMLAYPDMAFDAVDPGRLIYGGGLEAPWIERGGLSPVLAAVKARIIHIQDHPPGTVLGIGYGAPINIRETMRTAVVPIGFWDGLNHVPPLGEMLVRDRRCPVIGRRTFQHSILDVTAVPGAAIGDEVVVIGRQGSEEITIHDLADESGIPVIELVPRLARGLPHVYFDAEPGLGP